MAKQSRRHGMVARLAALSFAALIAGAAGCGDEGLSPEEATARCEQEKAARHLTWTAESEKQCLACYEECGDSCQPLPTPTPTFACAEEE